MPFPSSPENWIGCVDGHKASDHIANASFIFKDLGKDLSSIATVKKSREKDGCYISDLSVAFTDYALQELEIEGLTKLRPWIRPLVWIVDHLLKRLSFSRAIYVNNFPFSTTLYASEFERVVDDSLIEARDVMTDSWIIFRSLTKELNGELIKSLRERGAIVLPTRLVFLFEDWEKIFSRTNTRRDQCLNFDGQYNLVQGAAFSDRDFERATELYAELYIDKYSFLNPHYTSQFLSKSCEKGLLEFYGWKNDEGKLVAVLGLFGVDDWCTAPIVGYDRSVDQKEALYRRVIAKALGIAKARQMNLHLSAGAANFKLLRGGEPHIEYAAVIPHGKTLIDRLLFRGFAIVLGFAFPLFMRRFEKQ